MECQFLLDFAKKVYSIKFAEKPDYQKLRFMLTKILLDNEIVPSKKFDWNNYEESPRQIFENEVNGIENYLPGDYDEYFVPHIPQNIQNS